MEPSLAEQLLQAMSAFKKMHPRLLSDKSLSSGEMQMLFSAKFLSVHHGAHEPVHVSRLARSLHVSMPAVSQLLRSLEEKQLIERTISKEDRRKVAVALTDRGEQLLASARASLISVAEFVVSSLGEDDTRECIRLLNRIADIASIKYTPPQGDGVPGAQSQGKDETL